MSLKDNSLLESLIKKHWMYKGTCYFFSDYIIAGDDIIFSTDIKAIKIQKSALADFASNCLPAESAENNVVSLEKSIGVQSGVFSELTKGLLASFREIQDADSLTLPDASKKAAAKIGITKAINDIAKTAIAGKKAMGEKL